MVRCLPDCFLLYPATGVTSSGMTIALIISQTITLTLLWYLYRQVIAWNKKQDVYINNLVNDLNRDFVTNQLPPLKTVVDSPVKKLEHFVPSKDIDYIMSGKRVDPFD